MWRLKGGLITCTFRPADEAISRPTGASVAADGIDALVMARVQLL